jgi:hypothetical protein
LSKADVEINRLKATVKDLEQRLEDERTVFSAMMEAGLDSSVFSTSPRAPPFTPTFHESNAPCEAASTNIFHWAPHPWFVSFQ